MTCRGVYYALTEDEAKALLDRRTHGMQIGDLTGVPLPIVSHLGRKADPANALLEA